MKQLLDKVAYVTGAAGGIGRALALAFAAEGARVAVIDRQGEGVHTVAEQIKAAGGVALPLVVDVTDATGVPDSIARVHAALGAVDILVNNAGITDIKHRQVAELPLETWERILRVNVTGAFLCAQAVIPTMRQRRRGNIINVTSLLGVWRMAHPGDAPYCASKAALEALTDVLAKELRRDLINVNSLCPHTKLDTGFFAHLPPDERRGLDDPSVLAEPAVFLAALEPGTLTGLSLADLWWRMNPAYRDYLITERAVLARQGTRA